mgnify:CR=1 FL=1
MRILNALAQLPSPNIACLYFLPHSLIALIAKGPVESQTLSEGDPIFLIFP